MPKPTNEQVIVITGASSGIGRLAACELAKAGASVVLAARNGAALEEVTAEITSGGGTAHPLVTDVAKWDEVQNLAQETLSRFGRIDTWINNAGVSEYATLEDMAIEEIEQITQVTYMGQVYGVKAALPTFVQQDEGAFINIGSVVSKRSIPLQGAYSAAKHAVKGFSEVLRTEMEHEHPNIHVTLIMPATINTPFFEHARSRMGVEPQLVPPIYEPEAVVEAIVHAVQHPQPEIYIGSGAVGMALGEAISPGLVDRVMSFKGMLFKGQKSDQPDNGQDNLFAPVPGTGAIHGKWGEKARQTSRYTRYLGLHPMRKRALASGMAAAGLATVVRKVVR